MPNKEAKHFAFTMLDGMVAKQAAIEAYKDVFLVTAILCDIGILPALFIQDARKKSADLTLVEKQAEQKDQIEEENKVVAETA